MANIPQKPVVNNQQWINGQTKLNSRNLTSGVNENITNLKTAVDGIIDALGGPGAEPPSTELLIPITYSELVALRDSSSLVPGAQYRITDYQCTTVTENTSSAGHQFDIIVEADSVSTLNENAHAIQHTGDTYFANSNLEAWELKYCIDNDTDRFAWADTTNGKGVIYWMKDEFNNECPYDFKNMLYSAEASINVAGGGLFIRYPEADEGNHYMWKSSAYDDILVYTDTETPTVSSKAYYDEGDGNIQTLSITDVRNSITNSYTFAYTDNSVLYDASINGLDKSCYNNAMKEYHNSNKLQLNWNVFYSTSTTFNCYNNSFDRECHDNTFGNECYNNTFGNSCYGNTFGFGVINNTFDNSCYQNIIVNLFVDNTFGNSCYGNNFSGGCYGNTFGNSCYDNTFGSDFRYNTFSSNCYNNILGDHCHGNTFGDYCCRNIFGNSEGTINYCGYNIFDSNCSDINLCSEDTESSPSNQLQNVHVRLGVKGTEDTPLTLTVPDRNLPYETDFYLDASGNLKVSRFDIPQTLTAGAGISIENGVISVSYANADEEAF